MRGYMGGLFLMMDWYMIALEFLVLIMGIRI